MDSDCSATIDKASSTARSRKRKQGGLTTTSAGDAWSDQAPARLAVLGHPVRDQVAWQAWQRHLVRRRRPKPLLEVFSCKSHPLLWNAPAEVRTTDLNELIAAASSKNGKGAAAVAALAERRIGRGDVTPNVATATQDLALAHLLPKLAGILSGDTWWRLLEVLSVNLRQPAQFDEDVDGQSAWLDQLLAGELPLMLACQFPELGGTAELLRNAQRVLSEGLVGLTDGEGLLHARHLPWLRPLFACWTRCLAVATSAGCPPWSEDAQAQYEWLVRQALRLVRSDGSQAFGHWAACDWEPELFSLALELAGDDEDLAAADLSLPGDLRIPDADELACEPAVHSEWSQLAVLRCSWRRGAPRLAVNYAERDVFIELEAGREILLAGAWPLEILSAGHPLRCEGSWEEVCWLSDDDVDYLELSAELAGGGRLERQILLAREDWFLYLCDNVVDAPAAPLSYTSSLGIAEGIEVATEPETRELHLSGRSPRALVLPPALPEWRIDSRAGELEVAERRLQLRQRGPGRNLACPLFIDLQPRRLGKQRTWRQLTVAESLEICPRETAVAYRVQCGMAQWLFYRSLAPPANRTFFGQNISTEFFAGRFHRDGEVEELLETEGDE